MENRTRLSLPVRTWTRRGLLTGSGGLLGAWLLAGCADLLTPTRQPAAAGAARSPLVPSRTAVDPMTGIIAIAADSPQAREFAQRSIELVNAARIETGLDPLVESPVLTQVAQDYSRRMATEGFYGHTDPQGKDVTDRIAAAGYLAQMSAENIAGGQPDPETVVDGWLNSPGHRENIMNPDLQEIGAGYAYADSPPYYHYWTHVFATPDASVGRDLTQYPDQALAAINDLRQQAGGSPLTMDPTLTAIAQRHLEGLAHAQDFDAQVDPTLEAASQEALPGHQQIVALAAAGPGTPEDVVAKWAENTGNSNLADAGLTTAGIAYLFIEEDDYRHYWLLLMGG